MPRNIHQRRPAPLPHIVVSAGPFSPAETVSLTGISDSTLQNWTNKGYIGADKIGLGRGAKRRYSLSDVETILFGKDMVDAGIAPMVAFEYAPVVQKLTDEHVEIIRSRLIEDGEPEDAIERKLSDRVIELLACFAANPDVGSASKPYAVSILHGGKLHFQQLPSGKMAVLLLRVGLHKLGLASHLHQIRIDKQLKRKLAKSERDLLKGLEELDAEQKGKP